MEMNLLTAILKYVDSMLGASALIVSLFVLMTCRTMVKEIVNELKSTNTRVNDTASQLHGRISGIAQQLGMDYQTRKLCEAQHAYINSQMTAYSARMDKLETKLDQHTEQILTAIRGE